MAGGMSGRGPGRSRRPLAERVLGQDGRPAARAGGVGSDPDARSGDGAPGPEPRGDGVAGPAPGIPAVVERPGGAACWVVDPPGHAGRFPGVIRRWHRHPASGDWWARVTYDLGSPPVVAEAWLPAGCLAER